MKRLLSSLLIAALLLLSVFPLAAFAEEEAAESVTLTGITEISKYGNVKLSGTHEAILSRFEMGDLLRVSFGETTLTLPLCTAYSDVDTGSAALFLMMDGENEEIKLAVNNGDFATSFGIADKTVFPDKTYEWNYREGFSAGSAFTFSLAEKGGYKAEYLIRRVEYSNERGDYPSLTDAQFANFRAVSTTGLAENRLYRSASPVDPSDCRNLFADRAAKEAGVTVFIDLGDAEDELAGFEGEAESWFASQTHIAVAATMDTAAAENRAKYAEAFRFMAAHEGTYCVFCRQGKDRTGFFIAVLECLTGATLEEVTADYMTSFENWYGIEKGSEMYGGIAEGSFFPLLSAAFDTGLENADLKAEAADYLRSLGLTEDEIAGLKENLCKTAPATSDTLSAALCVALAAITGAVTAAGRKKSR